MRTTEMVQCAKASSAKPGEQRLVPGTNTAEENWLLQVASRAPWHMCPPTKQINT